MNLRKLTCLLLGHNLDPEVEERHGITYCRRCGADDSESQESLIDQWDWYWELRERVQSAKWVVQAWLAPCPDCGRRFGRHD